MSKATSDTNAPSVPRADLGEIQKTLNSIVPGEVYETLQKKASTVMSSLDQTLRRHPWMVVSGAVTAAGLTGFWVGRGSH